MGKVVADITISLDGFVTAPGADLEHGLGVDGEALHNWVFNGNRTDQRMLDSAVEETGAVIMGRHLFDIVDAPGGWSETRGYGADRDQSAPPPCFVVTHTRPDSVRLSKQMTIVTTGIFDALSQARQAAGDRDIVIMGGGEIIASYLAAGLVDELSLHIAPLALGGGTPLFDRRTEGFDVISCVTTPNSLHVRYHIKPR